MQSWPGNMTRQHRKMIFQVYQEDLPVQLTFVLAPSAQASWAAVAQAPVQEHFRFPLHHPIALDGRINCFGKCVNNPLV